MSYQSDRPQPITVVGLQIAKATRLPMTTVTTLEIETAAGIVGDRYHGSRHRQVSVQSTEELDDAAAELGRPIDPTGTRRNITLSHGAIPRRPGDRITIGEVELEVVREAAPCKLLDDALGDGARTALRRRAGAICRVLEGGHLALGAVASLEPAD